MPEELKIPEQHAFETGNVVTPARPGDGVVVTMVTGASVVDGKISGGTPTVVTGATHFSAPHNAAAILHGWGKKDEAWGHRHHAGEPLKLTQSDYLKALEAAGNTDAHGEYVPHPAALSPHCEARAHHERHAAKCAELDAKRAIEAGGTVVVRSTLTLADGETLTGSKRPARPSAEPTEAAKV